MSTAKVSTTKPKQNAPSNALQIKQVSMKRIPIAQFVENARKREAEYKFLNIEKGGSLSITGAEAYVTKRYQSGNRTKFVYMPILQLAGTVNDILGFISKIEVKDPQNPQFSHDGLRYSDLRQYFGLEVPGNPEELIQPLSREFIIREAIDPLEASGKEKINAYKAEIERIKSEHPGEKKGKFKYTIDEDLQLIRGLKREEESSVVVDVKAVEESKRNARTNAINNFTTLMRESLETGTVSRYISLNNYNPITMTKQQTVNKQPPIGSNQSIVPLLRGEGNVDYVVPIYVGLKNEKDYFQRVISFYHYVNDVVSNSSYYPYVKPILDSFNLQFQNKTCGPSLQKVLADGKEDLTRLYNEIVTNSNMRANLQSQVQQQMQQQISQTQNLDLSHLPQEQMGSRSGSPVGSVQSPIQQQ